MSNVIITCKRLVLVEGWDEGVLLPCLILARGLPDFQIISYDGKDNLRKYLKGLPTIPGFFDLSGLVVFRDADDDADATFQSVRDALRDAKLPTPTKNLEVAAGSPNVAVFVAPGNGASGELEDCCISSVAGDARIACVDAFVACLERIQGEPLRKVAKVKTQAFLASCVGPKRTVGDGAKAGVWPLNHAAFDGFAQALEMIA